MKNKDTRWETLLWVLVLFNSTFIIMGFFVYGIGFGRWECVEYQTITSKCVTIESKNNTSAYCSDTREERICVKEVWAHNILK